MVIRDSGFSVRGLIADDALKQKHPSFERNALIFVHCRMAQVGLELSSIKGQKSRGLHKTTNQSGAISGAVAAPADVVVSVLDCFMAHEQAAILRELRELAALPIGERERRLKRGIFKA
ncbi:hypothetical protein [Poriferisphaera sp. WC338]|uniref:hypothetical protein n=1 Tax=Poriferisphaera sp. WC338 TaxID=3425129 RepID=UPI003D812C01